MCPDTAAARRFYGPLFHWTAEAGVPASQGGGTEAARPEDASSPGDPARGGVFTQGGIPAAGYLPLARPGCAAHWRGYVAVTNVEETLARAESLGAKRFATAGPSTATGHVAALRDPQGGILRLVQAGEEGPRRPPPSAAEVFCWHDLATTNREAATRFYAGLFGWEPRTYDMEDTVYTSFFAAGRPLCGMVALDVKGRRGHGKMPRWSAYVSVLDADLATRRATKLGATIVVPPTDVPLAGRFAVFRDPQGAELSLLAAGSIL